MKQNNLATRFTESGSPITLPTISDKDHLSSQIKEMEGIAGRLTEAEKQKRPLAELLDGNFCVGENHKDISPKRFLIENMSTFKERGFSVLFMEHLAADRDLGKRLSNLDFYHMEGKSSEYNFTNVVKAAQENGIEIVNLEESNEIYKKYKDGPERMVSLNYNAREVIEKKEQEVFEGTGKALKWLAFVGSAHLKSNCGVPGICEIIPNVQDVLIADSGKIVEGLNVSMFIDGSSGQDMKIASILDLQSRDEANELKKRDRSLSEEELLPGEGLAYRLADGKEAGEKESDPKPFSKIARVGNSSAASAKTLVSNPSKTSVTKS